MRLSRRLCTAGLIGFIGIPSTITALVFFFLGMSALRLCALDGRSGCRRTIYFAAGVDPFSFFRRFFRAPASGEKLHQRRFLIQVWLAFYPADQFPEFVVGLVFVGEP